MLLLVEWFTNTSVLYWHTNIAWNLCISVEWPQGAPIWIHFGITTDIYFNVTCFYQLHVPQPTSDGQWQRTHQNLPRPRLNPHSPRSRYSCCMMATYYMSLQIIQSNVFTDYELLLTWPHTSENSWVWRFNYRPQIKLRTYIFVHIGYIKIKLVWHIH